MYIIVNWVFIVAVSAEILVSGSQRQALHAAVAGIAAIACIAAIYSIQATCKISTEPN